MEYSSEEESIADNITISSTFWPLHSLSPSPLATLSQLTQNLNSPLTPGILKQTLHSCWLLELTTKKEQQILLALFVRNQNTTLKTIFYSVTN